MIPPELVMIRQAHSAVCRQINTALEDQRSCMWDWSLGPCARVICAVKYAEIHARTLTGRRVRGVISLPDCSEGVDPSIHAARSLTLKPSLTKPPTQDDSTCPSKKILCCINSCFDFHGSDYFLASRHIVIFRVQQNTALLLYVLLLHYYLKYTTYRCIIRFWKPHHA